MNVLAEPQRIVSANVAARRVGVSQAAFSKHVRRGLIVPDFVSDVGSFFSADRLPEIKRTIEHHRLRNWRYMP